MKKTTFLIALIILLYALPSVAGQYYGTVFLRNGKTYKATLYAPHFKERFQFTHKGLFKKVSMSKIRSLERVNDKTTIVENLKGEKFTVQGSIDWACGGAWLHFYMKDEITGDEENTHIDWRKIKKITIFPK